MCLNSQLASLFWNDLLNTEVFRLHAELDQSLIDFRRLVSDVIVPPLHATANGWLSQVLIPNANGLVTGLVTRTSSVAPQPKVIIDSIPGGDEFLWFFQDLLFRDLLPCNEGIDLFNPFSSVFMDAHKPVCVVCVVMYVPSLEKKNPIS